MAIKDILQEIKEDVADVYDTKFEYTSTSLVPNSHTGGLTFERGVYKTGKMISTCVLYVDIRNSVELTKKHNSLTMAKVYTAFIKAVIKAGRYHGASTRNIIGDRVMLVFPSENCYHHAVDCAISINYIASKIIKVQFPQLDFKCGIGIDFGELKVIKVGIQRNGIEKSENKGLVWTGYPANLASRLTDVANKSIKTVSYKVNYNANRNYLAEDFMRMSNLHLLGRAMPENKTPYNIVPTDAVWTEAKFAESIELGANGELKFKEGKLNSLKREELNVDYPPILFTERVYDGLRRTGSARFKDNWKLQQGSIKDVSSKIYGGDYTWTV